MSGGPVSSDRYTAIASQGRQSSVERENFGSYKCRHILRGRAGEVVEMLECRSVDVCCVQEVRWRGASVRFVEGRRARYKLFLDR